MSIGAKGLSHAYRRERISQKIGGLSQIDDDAVGMSAIYHLLGRHAAEDVCHAIQMPLIVSARLAGLHDGGTRDLS